ncbi:L-serine ammonia-lyase, iron-sulfur-dependent, subunit alpha, partial [Oleiphilus sp. HI0117]
NGFGAIKAYAAASLAMHGNGSHLITLDNCIAAMKQTGEAMSEEFKETSQGGLAVRWVDC